MGMRPQAGARRGQGVGERGVFLKVPSCGTSGHFTLSREAMGEQRHHREQAEQGERGVRARASSAHWRGVSPPDRADFSTGHLDLPPLDSPRHDLERRQGTSAESKAGGGEVLSRGGS